MGCCLVPTRRRWPGPPLHRDCEYEDVAFDIVNQGHKGVRNWATGFLDSFPDLQVEPIRSFEHDRHAVLEWKMGGTHLGDFDGLAPTRRQWSVRGVTVLDIEDGRIERCADYGTSVPFVVNWARPTLEPQRAFDLGCGCAAARRTMR
jgi:steroid delta-isomerase-like uncharacterized protein